jgi:GDPmannose 4,6-dehydratase
MEKRALITGITGQDGAYLARMLLKKGYKVYGTFRRTSTPNFWRLYHLGIYKNVTLIPFDLSDMSSMMESIKISRPAEIYNLGAQSYVGAAFGQPIMTSNVDGISVTMFLEAIRNIDTSIKFYQASTSEMFGERGEKDHKSTGNILNEESYFEPASPYGAAKLYAYWMNKIYRKGYNLFACQGILFNHESPLRGLEFVTRKITNSAARIKLGLDKELHLGNIESVRDWGYAEEYVEAMWLMMQRDKPDDYVIATGEAHSVKEFAEKAFDAVGLNWEDHVKTQKKLNREVDVNYLCGDSSKAKHELGWKPKTTFAGLVKMMVDSDLERWKLLMDGKTFPWDAPNYEGDLNIKTRAIND